MTGKGSGVVLAEADDIGPSRGIVLDRNEITVSGENGFVKVATGRPRPGGWLRCNR